MTDFQNENDVDWGEPTESHPLSLEGSEPKSKADEDWIRVDGTVSASWKGQSGCCDQGRVDAEWKSAFDAWIEQQKVAHSTLEYLYGGTGAASGECRKWDNWPNGRRCNGTLSGPGYAYFRQP